MPRFEQRDKDGNLTETFVIHDATLKAEPDALLRQQSPKGSRAATAPEGYELVASLDNDPDTMTSDVTVHYFAKKGSYEREKPSKLAGLKAAVAEIETKKEEGVTVK